MAPKKKIDCEEMKTECAIQINDLSHEVKSLTKELADFKSNTEKRLDERIEKLEKRLDETIKTFSIKIENLIKRLDKITVKLLLVSGGLIVLVFLIQVFVAPLVVKWLTKS